MYPEGWLMDPQGRRFFYFEKDPMNPIYEGYIGLWFTTGDSSKEFKFRKRTSKTKALTQWTDLVNQGWIVIEDIEQAA